jgi:malto-oligosyltrehalose trehalohydrolase
VALRFEQSKLIMVALKHSPARTVRREYEMKFGTQLTQDGCRFRLWAPECETVSLHLHDMGQTIEMQSRPRGWYEIEVSGARAGMRYGFVLANGREVPDPASRYQPEDVEGPSQIVDPLAFEWTDLGWRGRPWDEAVIYEMHVGTFTPEGTFRAATEKLDYLAELGVTTIELMPVAEFPGRWNWGYDGVLLYAPDCEYGTPDDLKALVDAAHQRGLMVMLDVVYNHFGPKGNYLSMYTPALTDKHVTPWGMAVNFDDEDAAMMRDFAIANAKFWVNEYRFDGLRFDAVHEIRDAGPRHMLQEMAEQVRAATDGRYVYLVAENSDNQAGWMKRRPDLRPTLYTAQWSDDIHHCLHAAVTGEAFEYYVDYAGRPDLLGRALAEGLAFQGEVAQYKGGPRGEPGAHLPPLAFVSFIQNHDQVGNRPHGDRLHAIAAPEAVRAIAAINLLSPHVPLLFMGEEWGSLRPFPYFTDIGEDLAETIRRSRMEEFADSPWASQTTAPPDPVSRDTFESAKLDWSEPDMGDHEAWLELYRTLLALRQSELVPRLLHIEGHNSSYEVFSERGIRVTWRLGDGSLLTLTTNLSPEPIDGLAPAAGREIWREGEIGPGPLSPWAVQFTIEDASQ